MRQLLFLVLNMTGFMFSYSQEKGIHFERQMTWDQILVKASKSHKYIFVDCYTTWCGPCKQMDNNVFVNDNVGLFFNESFISVKLQMDTSSSDNDLTKKCYATARDFNIKYKINGYPSFLFFSSEGMIVHRFLGYLKPDDIMSIGKEALDTTRQYYTLLNAYERHMLDKSFIPYLAIRASLYGERRMADSIAQDYITNYLLLLSPDRLFTIENLSFMERFTKKPSDKAFSFFMNNSSAINNVLGTGKAEKMLIKDIIDEELTKISNFSQFSALKWQSLQKSYEQKYGKIGGLAVLEQRLLSVWSNKNDWEEYGRAYVDYFQNIGNFNGIHINNASWDVFEHVTSRRVLLFAVEVMAQHKDDDFGAMDTYANLLYKLGRSKDAIALEKKLVDSSKEYALKYNVQPDPTFAMTLERMKEGRSTWSDK